MTEPAAGDIPIVTEGDIVAARKAVREAAAGLGFGLTDVTRVVTAASELARNIFVHAGSGVMRWQRVDSGARSGLEIVFSDTGPGIEDVDAAFTPGYTTCHGLGLGLPGTRRLMDEMEVHSPPGEGTTVTVRKWLGS